jgi:hypothetical protein
VSFRFRPWRTIYEFAICVVAVAAFGWWVLVPLTLTNIDIELKPK